MDDGGTTLGLGPGSLNESLPTPLYHQIYLVLRDRIRRGELTADAALPGEQELSRLFNVSRITVKRALNELAADGLVSRHRGRGTIVTANATLPMVTGAFDNLIESLTRLGVDTQVELLDVADVPADAWAAGRLGLELGASVQRATRRRKIQDEPFSHLVTYVPAEIAAGYSREELAREPLLKLLERAGAGAWEAEQWITADAASPAIAAALGVAPASPLLKIERVMRDRQGRAVQLICGHYRPDRFQYHVKSRRSSKTDEAGWA